MPSNGRALPLHEGREIRPAGLPQDLWAFWKAYTHRASTYQSSILLSLVYYLVLGPSATISRLTGKRLLPSADPGATTYWMTRSGADKNLASLERQF